MKTFTKTLIATGLGLLGTGGVTQAAVEFGAAPSSYESGEQSHYGIAAGGCYLPPTSNRDNNAYRHDYGDHYGSPYRPAAAPDDRYGERRHERDRLSSNFDRTDRRPLPSWTAFERNREYQALPSPINRGRKDQWNQTWKEHHQDDFHGVSPERWQSKPSAPYRLQHSDNTLHIRYEGHFDDAAAFEAWRPLNASNSGWNN